MRWPHREPGANLEPLRRAMLDAALPARSAEGARWFRGFVCAQEDHRCTPGPSALEYYWQAASALERDQALTQAVDIESSLRAGAWQDLPLPELDSLDYRRLWEGA